MNERHLLRSTRRSWRSRIGAVVVTSGVRAQSAPALKVFKDPNCKCCSAWVEHLRSHGFETTVSESSEMKAVKARFGVPAALSSCHTAELSGYVIEGHVPAHAIQRLLAEKPQAIGLAVPGMPAGSPGMGGEPEPYDVVIFTKDGQRSFGRYKADRPIS